jgi:hypothetical protein
MGKKSEARALRKALAQDRFEAGKLALLAKVHVQQQPRHINTQLVGDTPRLAPHLARAAAEARQIPKAIQDGSRFDSRMSWCVSKADRRDIWSWGEAREWTHEEWNAVIHPPFLQFAQLTWKEIDNFSSDTGHKMHHGHEVGDLIGKAQARWRQLDLEQYDSVFRFRLGGQRRRAWGFIVQAHFHFVWWDREHSIYPTEQS